MALTYSLKYKKLNISNKVLLEKEGEIVVDRNSFRLKGKGAKDQGEVIYFGDMKELKTRDESLAFSTFSKERYLLSDFSNLYDAFLKDFMRVRNEYFADALFMKEGMLIKEFDGHVEILNMHGKLIPKGMCRIQFYERSIILFPEGKECFSIPLNFVKGHEFNEEEYVFQLFLENGSNIMVSKLGTTFEDVQETMEGLLSKMYQDVFAHMQEFMPDFDSGSLLKLAYKMKEGRFVCLPKMKKVHEDLPAKLEEMVVARNEKMADRIEALRKMGKPEHFFVSVSFGKGHDSGENFTRTWFMQGLPEMNLIAVGRTSSVNDDTIHFFRIIMQQGDPVELMAAKILEIEKSLLRFKYDFSVVYKNRRDLRKSRYRTALKKLSFLRLIRKSYVGKSMGGDLKALNEKVAELENKVSITANKAPEAKRLLPKKGKAL